MASEATRAVAVGLRQDLSQCLWLAMHDDDDLAHDMLQRCVYNGLQRVVEELPAHFWLPIDYRRMIRLLAEAQAELNLTSGEMARRWHDYGNPPF